MKLFKQTLLPFSLLTTIFLLDGCALRHDVVSISDTHYYDEQYGVNQNSYADSVIAEELNAQNQPTEVDKVVLLDPTYTTDNNMEPDTFLAEDYVQKPDVITYKYPFDDKFYSKPEWRKMDLDGDE